jgi:hypothetical protein
METIERGSIAGRENPQVYELANEAAEFCSYEQETILYRNFAQVLDCVEERNDPLKGSRIKKKDTKRCQY